MPRFAILALLLVGCGVGNNETMASPLTNTEWSTAAGDCTTLAFFPDAERYTASRVCYRNGGIAVQSETGTYRTMGSVLTVAPATSSCPGSAVIDAGEYSIVDSRLTLGSVVFERQVQRIDPTTSAGGTVPFGCL